MTPDKQRRLSKKLSYHLRHAPHEIGLKLEAGGWVKVNDLLAALRQKHVQITHDQLAYIVANCDKQRFAFSEAKDKIRANQGHSVEVEMDFAVAEPPATLYHGTVAKYVDDILRDGLKRMTRHHVHLSVDVETATKVGSRHGKPVILAVAAGMMHANGHVLKVSANGVWLADEVPPQYITALA